MITVLKIDRALFGLLIVVTNALATLTEALISVYGPTPIIIVAVGAVQSIANGVIVYLATEQQAAPA
jgi:hypothetical protein